MAGTQTFTMIKPDAVRGGHIGSILKMITDAGFKIKAMKYTRLSKDKAGEFYAVHRERPFYGELVDFMSSGPIVAAVLEKDNAVVDFRKLIGATNPAEAEAGPLGSIHCFELKTKTPFLEISTDREPSRRPPRPRMVFRIKQRSRVGRG